MKCSCSFAFHVLLLYLFGFNSSNAHVENTNSEQMQLTVPVGVVLDLNSTFGSMMNLCMDMAISDFYSLHSNYETRLQLHKKDAKTVLDVNLAVLDLLEREQVHGILGPQQSTEDIFVSELGTEVHVPIVSFTARSLALPNTENSFFVRTTLDDSVQARALAAICHEFNWTEVVVLYENTEYGRQFLSHLSNAFQDVEIGLVHPTAIPTSANDSSLSQELSVLCHSETKVFLVHMNPSLGFRLFTLAQNVGMMSEGYAWIISDSLSNFLNSIGSATHDSIEGIVGVRPCVPFSQDLENFQERWKRNRMIQKKDEGSIMDLNVYGLWAYDRVTALATAVETIGPVNSSSLYVKSGSGNTNLRISAFGPRLLRELSSTKFRGLSGDFELVDGKLKPSAFEIFNLIGTGERRVGFWTPERGITRHLKNIVWPGDSLIRPKGWSIPPTGSLRVGVPWKPGFKEFVNVVIDPVRNHTNATGFSIDIFLAALKQLPFRISYTFHCYNGTTSNRSYDDMLRRIPQDYDVVVGDTTIWAPRASHVDFALPYLESGVVLVVKNDKASGMWIFTKPLRWDLWLAIVASFIYMGVIIWILESQEPNPAPAHGEELVRRQNERLQITYLAPVAALAFQDRTIVSNNWSVFVLVCWLFMAYILMQSFTANLSAMLTLDQLKFSFSEDHFFGYQEASFMKDFLTERLNIKESRLRNYSSVEGFHDAMSRGSKNGGVDAIFDENPYMKLFLNRYGSQYKIVGPTYRTDGFGFAFPIGSPLAAYFSRAILNVTQGPEMIYLEQKNLGPGYSSQDPLSSTVSQGSSSLTFHEFGGLFIIVGSLAAFAPICSKTAILRKLSYTAAQIISKLHHKVRANPPLDDDVAADPVADHHDDVTAAPGGDGDGVIVEGGQNNSQEDGGESRNDNHQETNS